MRPVVPLYLERNSGQGCPNSMSLGRDTTTSVLATFWHPDRVNTLYARKLVDSSDLVFRIAPSLNKKDLH